MVFVRRAGIVSAGGSVHLEVAGGGAAVVVGFGRMDDRERRAAPRHAKDMGMASRQPLGCNAKRCSLLCGCIDGHLRHGTFFGDAAAIAGASARAAALPGVSSFLPAAASGVELLSDEPIAELF